jgi:hypothetical protein
MHHNCCLQVEKDILRCVWDKLDYCIDICHVNTVIQFVPNTLKQVTVNSQQLL